MIIAKVLLINSIQPKIERRAPQKMNLNPGPPAIDVPWRKVFKILQYISPIFSNISIYIPTMCFIAPVGSSGKRALCRVEGFFWARKNTKQTWATPTHRRLAVADYLRQTKKYPNESPPPGTFYICIHPGQSCQANHVLKDNHRVTSSIHIVQNKLFNIIPGGWGPEISEDVKIRLWTKLVNWTRFKQRLVPGQMWGEEEPRENHPMWYRNYRSQIQI